MVRRLLLAVAMAAPACTTQVGAPKVEQPRQTSPASPSALVPLDQPSNEEVLHEVVTLVIAAERAYLEQANTTPLTLLLSPNVKIQAGRARTPGAFDMEFGKERLVTINEWCAANDVRVTAEFERIGARVSLDTVDLELRLEGTNAEGERYWFGQTFRLVKTSGAWRIVEHRYWPINPDTELEFSAEYFEETDQRIQEELRVGDERNAAYHMILAYRFDEAAVLSRRLTSDESADAWAWDLRARASALIGDARDAETSIRMARDLASKGAK